MPEKAGDLRPRLSEDLLRYELLVRTQPKDTQLIEPFGNGIPNAVRQTARRRKINLIPAPFAVDTRANRPRKHAGRQLRDGLRQTEIIRRVLLSMPGQGAAIADQMAE